jgi:hypothetical protein
MHPSYLAENYVAVHKDLIFLLPLTEDLVPDGTTLPPDLPTARPGRPRKNRIPSAAGERVPGPRGTGRPRGGEARAPNPFMGKQRKCSNCKGVGHYAVACVIID